MTEINSQSLEDTQVEHILQKYTYDKYTFGKYTFGKYTFEKYALRFTYFTFHFWPKMPVRFLQLFRLISFDLSDRYWDICKKQCLGTSWMGWGPVDWVRRVLPEAKFEKKST